MSRNLMYGTRVVKPDKFRSLLFKAFPGAKDLGGGEMEVNCPFHPGDSGRNLAINYHKGIYHCWVCGKRGSAKRLVTELVHRGLAGDKDIVGVFKNDKDADLARLKSYLHDEDIPSVEQIEEAIAPTKVWPDNTYPIEECLTIANASVLPVINAGLKYLRKRGWSNQDIIDMGVRMSIDVFSRFYGRVIIPVFDSEYNSSKVVHWVARAISKDLKPKVLNSSSKTFNVMKAANVLFGASNICDGDRVVAVCEGIFDAVSMWKKVGVKSVAILGKTIHSAQINTLYKRGVKVLLVALDGDDVGREAARELIDRVRLLFDCRLIPISDGMDPDEMSREDLVSAVLNVL